MKDFDGNNIQPGDRVAYAVIGYRRAHLRVGEVTQLHDNGEVTVKPSEWGQRSVTKKATSVVRVEAQG